MLRYLIQVVENLTVTGVLTALLWAVLVKEGEWRRKRFAVWGCAAGAATALVIAVLRRTTALINRGFFNTWTLSFAILLGILHILFLWGFPRKLFQKRPLLAETFSACVNALLLGMLLLYALPTIFLYPTEFVLPGESIFSTDFLFCLIGFAAGLALVTIGALAIYKTAKALPGIPVKALLSVALLVAICNQAIVIVQFLLARRIIPMIRWLFAVIIAGVNNSALFTYALMGISFFASLLLFIRGFREKVTGNNPAERRKLRAARRTSRRWCLTVAVVFTVSVLAMTVFKGYTEREVVLSPAEPMTIEGGEILIPLTQIEDGHLHRFALNAQDGTEVRFIVIKKNAVAYGVGLDACDICGATGYYERKDEVICRLCDVVMNISTIGFKGGCNPVPLAYGLRSGFMVIE
ncbi:MAG: Fe-S-containing protein, partial [Spirochaetaceae bacterium]|nr:Fe-S-containing protein [Spirochaetaceae bacterium]